jgi:hypothetical protein
VRRLYLFDASALIALFEGHPAVIKLMERAWTGQIIVGFPAVAVAIANVSVGVEYEQWREWLREPGTVDLPLTVHAAADLAAWPGALDARHCVYEARATNGAVVTRTPSEYEGLPVPLLVV